MKGGKAGRERRSAGVPARPGAERGKPKKGSARRPPNAPPKKGSRKKPEYGGIRTAGDE
jgi:hypothetical protein